MKKWFKRVTGVTAKEEALAAEKTAMEEALAAEKTAMEEQKAELEAAALAKEAAALRALQPQVSGRMLLGMFRPPLPSITRVLLKIIISLFISACPLASLLRSFDHIFFLWNYK